MFLNDKQIYTHSPWDAGQVKNLSSVHSINVQFALKKLNFDTMAFSTSNDMFVRYGVNELFDKYPAGQGGAQDSLDSWKIRDKGIKELIEKLEKHSKLNFIIKNATEGSWYPKEIITKTAEIILNEFDVVSGDELIIPTVGFSIDHELWDKTFHGNFVFHNAEHAAVSFEDIMKVRNGEMPGQFSVKRVPRQINDNTRIYIRNLTKND